MIKFQSGSLKRKELHFILCRAEYTIGTHLYKSFYLYCLLKESGQDIIQFKQGITVPLR